MKNTPLLFFFLSFSYSLLANEPAHYYIDDKNLIPTNEIYSIQSDADHQLWFGSNVGLFSFDGIRSRVYVSKEQNSHSVSFLSLDQSNTIWAKNFLGQLMKVDEDTLKVIASYTTSTPHLPIYLVNTNNQLLVVEKQLIRVCDQYGDFKSTIELSFLEEKEDILQLLDFQNNYYLLTSRFNLYTLDQNFNVIKQSNIGHVSAEKISANSHFIADENDIYLYVESFSNKLHKSVYTVKNKLVKIIEFKNYPSTERIHKICKKKDEFWVLTNDGVKVFDNHFTLKHHWFKGNLISDMFIDQDEMLWFSTLNKGIIVVPNRNINVLDLDIKEEIINTHVVDDTLVFGTYSGNLYKFSSGCIKQSPIFKHQQDLQLAVKKVKKYANYTIISRGRLCIYDHLNANYIFPKISNIRDYELVGDSLIMIHPDLIFTIRFDDLVKNKIKYRVLREEGGKSVAFNANTGELFISLSNGVYSYKNYTWTELKYKDKPIYASSLTVDEDMLWIGTVSNGVLVYSGTNFKYHFSSTNGFSETLIKTIKSDRKNTWILTDKNLYKWEKNKQQLSRFGKNLGLPVHSIVDIEISNNNLFITTQDKLFYFPCSLSLQSEYKPKLYVLSVKDNDRRIAYYPEIRLPYDNKQVSIQVASYQYQNRGNYYYEYKMSGLSEKWIKVSPTASEILFPALRSGNYELELRINNLYGKNSDITSLKIKVALPIWKSIWFIVSCFSISLLVLIIVFKKRERFIRNKAVKKNKLIKSQLTALKAQMNPHFLFNTLNSLQDLILMQDFKKTNFYLSKYSQLIRKTLEISDKNEISLFEEIELLEYYLSLEKLRLGDDFEYFIHVDPELDQDTIRFPPLLLQPFVENSLKHGLLHKKGKKQLQISFELRNKLVITITDNGIGRKKSREINQRNIKKHNSFATQATDKRIDLINEIIKEKITLTIFDLEKDAESRGTEIVLEMPLHFTTSFLS